MKDNNLQNLLDSLDEGPLGKPQEYWDNLDKLSIGRAVRYSKPVPEETRIKMSKAAKGRINKASLDPVARAKAGATMSKGVIAYKYPDMIKIGTYKNNKEASIALDIHPSIVGTVARGKYKQCKGLTFKYVDDGE